METLKERLKRHEEFRPEPYRDGDGWSIGWGHYMGTGGIKISRMVAGYILDEDIHLAESRFLSLGWFDLTRNRRDVCIEMIFWHGLKGFLGFKNVVQAIESEEWKTAGDELMDSNSGRSYPTRMHELRELMVNG